VISICDPVRTVVLERGEGGGGVRRRLISTRVKRVKGGQLSSAPHLDGNEVRAGRRRSKDQERSRASRASAAAVVVGSEHSCPSSVEHSEQRRVPGGHSTVMV
jgi:hypothetical protein